MPNPWGLVPNLLVCLWGVSCVEILWTTTWDSVFRGGRRDLKNLAFGVLDRVF